MTNQQLYQTIFKRKSIRKFDMAPLDTEVIIRLQEFIAKISPIIKNLRYKWTVYYPDDIKTTFAVKAPHYLCLYSEQGEGYLLNAGYMVELVDLYLSASNLGSCWLGLAKPQAKLPETEGGLEFVIMLAFGEAEEEVHRNSTLEFKRKPVQEITNITGAVDILEPVRLAPSASNSQPWFFSGSLKEIIVSRKNLNFIKAPILGKLNQIDIGIAMCHLILSLDNTGKIVDVIFNKEPVPKGHIYMATLKIRSNIV